MNPEQLRALGRLMNVINPYEGHNPQSNCVACSIHAAQALVGGDAFHTVADSWEEPSEHFGSGKRFAPGEDRAENVWAWLSTRTVPGGVYILSDSDHSFNVLRDFEGTLFLLDSNQQVYRELTRQSDCQVPDRRPGMPATATINLLGPGEDELRCFGTGLLHANYRFLGAPARPRADSQPGAHAANPARRNSVP